jgi:hypothetical protein
VIAEAVSNAVLEARAGYAVGLVIGHDVIEVRDPKLIRVAELLPGEEIDMSADAALLEATYAQRLLDATRTPNDMPTGGQPTGEASAATGEPIVAADERSTVAVNKPSGRSPGGSADTVGRVELRTTVHKDGLFDLNRAVSWLRENARGVQVEVKIDATGPEEGFDRVKLRNGLVEPLEEAGHVDIAME